MTLTNPANDRRAVPLRPLRRTHSFLQQQPPPQSSPNLSYRMENTCPALSRLKINELKSLRAGGQEGGEQEHQLGRQPELRTQDAGRGTSSRSARRDNTPPKVKMRRPAARPFAADSRTTRPARRTSTWAQGRGARWFNRRATSRQQHHQRAEPGPPSPWIGSRSSPTISCLWTAWVVDAAWRRS